MRSCGILSIMLVGAALAGCTGAPQLSQSQDVDFLRGCWAQKDAPGGRVEGFLRLLPSHGASEQTLSGDVIDASNGGWRPTHRLAFARDGSSMTIGIDPDPVIEMGVRITHRASALPSTISATLPPAPHRATWKMRPEIYHDRWMVAEGEEESLNIYLAGPHTSDREIIFKGERDGCD